jgi:ribosome maturation factor RimP
MTMDLKAKVTEIVKPYAAERGIEIVDVIYRREGQGMVLRVLADKREGITLDECEEMNNYLSLELDKDETIQERYILEVCSPGLDRHLVTDSDFERVMGQKLEANTYEPIDGRRAHEGVLIGMDKETIVIENNGISTVVPRDKIAMARLKIEI